MSSLERGNKDQGSNDCARQHPLQDTRLLLPETITPRGANAVKRTLKCSEGKKKTKMQNTVPRDSLALYDICGTLVYVVLQLLAPVRTPLPQKDEK